MNWRKVQLKLPSSIRKAIKRQLRRHGYELTRSLNMLHQLLERYEIDLVIDVGANVGQFGSLLRHIDYTGRIVSFEPLAMEYTRLANRARKDPVWNTYHYGLGSYDGEATINRSKSSVFSSLLPITYFTTNIYDGAVVTTQERITIRRLDSIFDNIRQQSRSILLKSDTQGFEKHVLDGATGCLSEIAGLHLELSYEPLYEGEPLFETMVQHVESLGFKMVLLEPLLHRETNRILQTNGTFFRPR